MGSILMTVAEAAEELGVAEGTVRRWFREGTIQGVRVGEKLIRVKRSEVARIMGGENG